MPGGALGAHAQFVFRVEDETAGGDAVGVVTVFVPRAPGVGVARDLVAVGEEADGCDVEGVGASGVSESIIVS